jgi:hypothetical protein
MDFYKFWQIINESKGIKNEWDPNEPDEGPEDHMQFNSAGGELEKIFQLVFKNGVFHDAHDGRVFPPIPYPQLQTIIGNPEDTYTMEVRIVASGDYIPGWDAGGGNSEDDRLHGEPSVEVDWTYIENDRTKKSVGIPSELIQDKVVGVVGSKATYQVDYDLRGGKIDLIFVR